MKPHGWCAVLASANDDVLGTVLAGLVERLSPRHPELVALVHRRWACASGDADAWFLRVAVVLRDPAPDPSALVIDSHPALCREVIRAMVEWSHRHPNLVRYAPGDPALTRDYYLARMVALPASPPPFQPDVVPSRPAAKPKPEPEPKPEPKAAPPSQGSLF